MSIRYALRKQSLPASRRWGREFDRWIGSNAILMMMAVFLLIVLAIEILRG